MDREGGIDVTVLVRTRPHPRPRLTEIGAICALRDGVPLIVAGTQVLNPFERWSAEMVDLDGVVAAVEAHLGDRDPPEAGRVTPRRRRPGPVR